MVVAAMDIEQLVLCLLTGACIATAVFVGREGFASVLDLVQHDLDDRFRSLKIKPSRLRTWIYVWLGILLTVFLALWLVTDGVMLAACVALLMAAGPWYLIRRMAARRREKIEDQLADAMVMFSASIRAGLSMAQSLDLLAMECPKPIQQEFSQIVGEYKMGKPMERTLREASERLRSDNFAIFAAALLASRESGGRLNDTVERISKSVLEMQRLERKLQTETAQARKSAVYMAIVPLLIMVVYFFIDPVNSRLLFVTTLGQIVLSIAVIFNLVAYFWAVRILNADI
jgi:tight adherence protein B